MSTDPKEIIYQEFLKLYQDKDQFQKWLESKTLEELKTLQVLLKLKGAPEWGWSESLQQTGRAEYDRTRNILQHQIMRMNKELSDELANFLINFFSDVKDIKDCYKSNHAKEFPLIKAVNSGNTNLFLELINLQKESFDAPFDERTDFVYKANFEKELSQPLIQGLLQNKNTKMFEGFLKYLFKTKHGTGIKHYVRIIAQELFFNEPVSDKEPDAYETYKKNRILFEDYMMKSDLDIESINQLFKMMIASKKLEVLDTIKYYSSFRRGWEVMSTIGELLEGITNSRKEEDKKKLYDLIDDILKEGMKNKADLRIPYQFQFYDYLHAHKLFLQCILDDRPDLAHYLNEIYKSYSKEVQHKTYPFNVRDLVSAYHSKNKTFLNMIEDAIGQDPKDKATFILQALDRRRDDTEQDFLDIFSLPIPWNKQDEAKLFEKIDEDRFLSADVKFNLKKTFEQTRDIVQKKKLESIQDINAIYAKLKKQTVILDARLFGNIHNDPNFQGTNIQGDTMTRNVRYLNDLIHRIANGTTKIPGIAEVDQKKYAETLLPLKSKFNTILAIDDRIDSFLASKDSEYTYNEPERKALALKKMVEEINATILNELKSTGSVLIPGGWRGIGQMPGHAMLYELKIEDGQLIFLVHNMGSGIEMHAQKKLADKTYYSSVRAFQCPWTGKFEDMPKNLVPVIESLIRPLYLPVADYAGQDSQKVYARIRKAVLDLGMQEVDPFNYSKEWVTGQLSGTCSFRVFESFLSSYPFSPPFEYQDIHYEILRNSLQEFYQKNKTEGTLQDETIQRQMNYAVQNLAILLQDLSEKEPKVLSERRIALGKDLINHIYQDLNRAKGLEIAQPMKPTEELSAKPSLHKTLTGTIASEALAAETEDAENSELSQKTWISSPPPRDADPKKIFEFISSCKNNFEAGFYRANLEAIEDFFVNFPYDKTNWTKLSRDDLEIVLKSIRDLQHLYGESVNRIDDKPFAERQITFMLAQILGEEIFQAYFKDNENVTIKAKRYLLAKNGLSIGNNLNSPFFTVLDPKFREKILFIREKYGSKLSAEEKKIMEEGVEKEFPLGMFYWLLDEKTKAELERIFAAELKKFKQNGKCRFEDSQMKKADKLESRFKPLYCYLQLYDEDPKSFRTEFPKLAQDFSMLMKMLQLGHLNNLSLQGKLSAINSPVPDEERYFRMYNVKLIQQDSGEYACLITDPFVDEYQNQKISSLADTQTFIVNPDVKKALETRSETSNTIQVETMEQTLSDKVGLLRTLKNIRLKPETQVTQAFDFIKSHLYKVLLDKDLQSYSFLTLFESPLLEQQLKKTPELLDNVLNLLQEGIDKYSKDNILSPEILFFYKFLLSFHQTLLTAEEGPEPELAKLPALTAFKKSLAKLEERVPAIIADLETRLQTGAGKTPQNEEFLYQFHLFNAESFGLKIQETKFLRKNEIVSLISSIVYLANHSESLAKDSYFFHLVNHTIAKIQAPMKEILEKAWKYPQAEKAQGEH